ncbi:MAG: glycosyltransferase family 4 protein, partial [Gemmatimonadota bacterium]
MEFIAPELGLPVVVGDRIDCIALAFLREARTLPTLRERLSSVRDAFRAARYERSALRAVTAMTVVGEADARFLKRLAPGRRVHVVPNGCVLGAPPDPSTKTPEPTLIFSGVFGFRPNVVAAQFFARHVFPSVRRRVPMARFIIAGRGTNPDIVSLGALPGVEVRSDVPDMGELLATAWVAVAPMRSGGGIKNKVLEAWAVGTPVVMSSLAANGLTPGYDRGCLVADQPRALVDAVVRLLTDPDERRRRGQAGFEFVRDQHTWGRAADQMTALLRGALAPSGLDSPRGPSGLADDAGHDGAPGQVHSPLAPSGLAEPGEARPGSSEAGGRAVGASLR